MAWPGTTGTRSASTDTSPKELDGFAWRAVFDIDEDASGDLWLATDRGVAVWQRATERFVHYRWKSPNPASLSSEGVRDVLVAKDGTLWVGTLGNGLNVLDRSTGRFERVTGRGGCGERTERRHRPRAPRRPDGRSSGSARRQRAPSGSTRARAASEPTATSRATLEASAMIGSASIEVDRDGQRLVRNQRRPVSPGFGQRSNRAPAVDSQDPRALPNPIVDAVVADRDGRVWVGTDGGGLSRLDPTTREFTHFRSVWFDAQSLASDVVLSLYEDRDGDLWVGTYPAGVNYAKRVTAAAIRTHPALPGIPHALSNGGVRAFEEDAGGDLWVGTDGGGLNRLDREDEPLVGLSARSGRRTEPGRRFRDVAVPRLAGPVCGSAPMAAG